MNKYQEIFKIGEIHKTRICQAVDRICSIFPITPYKIENMKEEDFVWIELLVNRFGKLQDYIGSKLINIYFEHVQEPYQNLAMLDKINKLEQLEMIESAELWKIMRDLRNHLAHEYPENPELTAIYLNQLFDLTPKLIKIFECLKSRTF
ncbi:MAG: hypothetical protein CNLJKLNK_01141 [Holosporales bacterium]